MDPDSLRHQALHLRKDRASIIGTIEDMVSQCLTRNQSSIDELTQFALHRPECDSRQSRKLAQVKRITHMSIENGEQSAAGAAEEGPGKHAYCTHFGVNRTRNGYTQSRVERESPAISQSVFSAELLGFRARVLGLGAS